MSGLNLPDKDVLYEKAKEYWTTASQDEEGMLGGFGVVHKADITTSRTFIKNLKNKGILENFGTAVDCGCGIGRVTKHLLLPMFEKVDMVDAVEELIEKSHEYVGETSKVGLRSSDGLQNFVPETGKYDLIWIQWVSGHLPDEDFIDFFKRCQRGITAGGVIVLKDNMLTTKKVIFDDEDHSLLRPESAILDLISKSGLKIVSRCTQQGFPSELYPVKIFAMVPQR